MQVSMSNQKSIESAIKNLKSSTLLMSLSILLFLLSAYYSSASFASSYSALHIQVSYLISFCFVFHASHLRIEDLCFLVSIAVRLSYLVLWLAILGL